MKRHLLSVTLREDQLRLVKEAAEKVDMPMTTWVREVIKREIEAQRNDPT
jgi:hypothetical protein